MFSHSSNARHFFHIFCLLFTAIPVAISSSNDGQALNQTKFNVVCYIYSFFISHSHTNNSLYPLELIDTDLCTHIIYDFGVIDETKLNDSSTMNDSVIKWPTSNRVESTWAWLLAVPKIKMYFTCMAVVTIFAENIERSYDVAVFSLHLDWITVRTTEYYGLWRTTTVNRRISLVTFDECLKFRTFCSDFQVLRLRYSSRGNPAHIQRCKCCATD